MIVVREGAVSEDSRSPNRARGRRAIEVNPMSASALPGIPSTGGARAWRSAARVVLLTAGFTLAAGAVGSWAGRVSYMGPPGAKAEDCDRCDIQALFAAKIKEYSASMELLELKNGMAILYSSSDPRMVPRVQRTVEWARDELTRVSRDPEHCKLCSYCKASYPIYSKVNREVVRTPKGAIFFMRSEDPEAVRALKAMLARARAENAPQAPSR
jgi:hypothetical protein